MSSPSLLISFQCPITAHTAFPGQWNLGSGLSILFNLTSQTVQSTQSLFSRFSGSPGGHPLVRGRETSGPGILPVSLLTPFPQPLSHFKFLCSSYSPHPSPVHSGAPCPLGVGCQCQLSIIQLHPRSLPGGVQQMRDVERGGERWQTLIMI